MTNNSKQNIFSMIFHMIFIIIFFSCSKSDEIDYLKYANDETNGLIVFNNQEDFKIRLNLIPYQYFLLKDLKDKNKSELKKEKRNYENSIYLKLSFIPLVKGNNIIDRNTFNEIEFKRKMTLLNFGFEKLVTMQIGEQLLSPVLSVVEDAYELNGSKSVLLVFNLEKNINEDVKIIYDDEIFTGEQFAFDFLLENINKIPKLEL